MAREYKVKITDTSFDPTTKFTTTNYPKVGFYLLTNGEIVYFDGTAVWIAPGMLAHFEEVVEPINPPVKEEAVVEIGESVIMTESGFIELMDKMVHGGLETGRFKGK